MSGSDLSLCWLFFFIFLWCFMQLWTWCSLFACFQWYNLYFSLVRTSTSGVDYDGEMQFLQIWGKWVALVSYIPYFHRTPWASSSTLLLGHCLWSETISSYLEGMLMITDNYIQMRWVKKPFLPDGLNHTTFIIGPSILVKCLEGSFIGCSFRISLWLNLKLVRWSVGCRAGCRPREVNRVWYSTMGHHSYTIYVKWMEFDTLLWDTTVILFMWNG